MKEHELDDLRSNLEAIIRRGCYLAKRYTAQSSNYKDYEFVEAYIEAEPDTLGFLECGAKFVDHYDNHAYITFNMSHLISDEVMNKHYSYLIENGG